MCSKLKRTSSLDQIEQMKNYTKSNLIILENLSQLSNEVISSNEMTKDKMKKILKNSDQPISIFTLAREKNIIYDVTVMKNIGSIIEATELAQEIGDFFIFQASPV